ncbi:MAG: phosphotransferase, partial [Acidimicrobiia bacterium]|nr:phosphotransferase [Acidimicrobiia bacterium]
DNGRVVRLTHTSRRSIGQVEAEVAFMRHLAEHQVRVVAPIPSTAGNLVESFELTDGSPTVTYAMSDAPGAITHPRDWSDAHLVAMGELLAQSHLAASCFDPPGERRPAWTDPTFDPGMAMLADEEVRNVWRELIADAASHPAGGTDLLIHQDAHFGNVHLEDPDRITLFDFDDCGYGTAVHDIAMVFFYWLMVGWDDEAAAARRFFDRLLHGYRRHIELDDDWPGGIDRMLKVREAGIYAIISANAIEVSGFEQHWMEGRRQQLLDRVPLLGAPLSDVL